MVKLSCFLTGAAATALLSATYSEAQAQQRNVGVLERPRPDYEAVGARFGSFRVFPKVTGSVFYDSNIFATETNEDADTFFLVQPEVNVTSDWSRHALEAHARAVFTRYVENDQENADDYVVGTSGRLDVLRSTRILGGAEYSNLTEARTATNTVRGLQEPVQYDLTRAYVEGQHDFVDLRLRGRVEYREFDYKNGVDLLNQPVLLQDRDREILDVIVRGGYAVSPDTSFFVEVAHNTRKYRLKPPVVAQDRDSDGYEVTAGANFQITQLIAGEVQAGYLRQKYDASSLDNVEGFAMQADVDWFVTQLTTLGFTAIRTIDDPADFRAAGLVSTQAAVTVDHELLRNVILSGRLRYEDAQYKGIDREDKVWGASVNGTYLLNRRVGLSGGYAYLKQESNGLDRSNDFDVHRLFVSVVLQY